MSTDNPQPLRHLHYFLSKQHEQNERRVWMVIALSQRPASASCGSPAGPGRTC